MEKINKIISIIFPSNLTPNIYAYPEVKILNYLDAQYYGYTYQHSDLSALALQNKNLKSSSTLDHPISGSPLKNADSPLPAIFINTLIQPRVQPTTTMVPNSTLPMVQELSKDLLDRTQSLSLDLKQKKLTSVKSLNFTV